MNFVNFIDEKVKNVCDEKTINHLYTQWSETYDEDMQKEDSYKGFRVVAKAIDLFSFGNKSKRILDIGAGTGLISFELRGLGYENIDALEPNEAMINKAKAKNLYKNYYTEFIKPDKPLQNIKNDVYDIVAAAGCFSKGHFNFQHINKLIDPVKQDGYLILAFRYTYIKDEQKEVIPEIIRLKNENRIKIMIMTEVPDYYLGVSGFLIVLQKL